MKFYVVIIVQIIKSLSFSRIYNYCKLCITFVLSHRLKKHYFVALPSFLSIEPTNICNLQCPECPTGNKSSIVPKGKIDVTLCQNLIQQIENSVLWINLYFQGEPFVCESVVEIIKMTTDAKIMSSISTNAHFIDDELAEKIVCAKLTKLIVSLDGYNQESYEKYRRNGKFQKVVDGLQSIQRAKQKYHSALPLVELQCLLFSHTETHKDEIRRIGLKYDVDKIVFKRAQFYSSENIDMLPSRKKNSRYKVADGTMTTKKSLRNKCWKLWSSCIVAWNGNVLPCCFDKNHTFSYGNIGNQSFQDIWFSNKSKNFKKTIHTNRKQIDICQNCSM